MKTQIHRISLTILAGLALTVGSAHASLLAYDNFSSYTASPTSINNQYGVVGPNMVGFAGSRVAAKKWASNTAVAVTGGVLTQGANLSRSRREFATTPLVSAGTIYVRARLAISNAPVGVNFSALELAKTINSDVDTVRLTGADGGLSINANGTGGVSSAVRLHPEFPFPPPTPISPPSGPTWAGVAQRRLHQWLFQGPPAESKLAICIN